jgi:hypothetical protein
MSFESLDASGVASSNVRAVILSFLWIERNKIYGFGVAFSSIRFIGRYRSVEKHTDIMADAKDFFFLNNKNRLRTICSLVPC